MKNTPRKPSLQVMQRVEELLREQLSKLGENPSEMQAHEISRHMQCGVHSDGALSYAWKGVPILDVRPEAQSDGSVQWRFFTQESPPQ